MNNVSYLLLFLFIGFSNVFFSQQEIQLMNGKVLTGIVKATFDDYYDFQYLTKNEKPKLITLPKLRVFSITDELNSEKLIYQQDSSIGNVYSANEMRMLVFGQRDAIVNVKKTPWFVTGFIAGFGAVVFDTYEFEKKTGCPTGLFQRTSSVAPIAAPITLTIAFGLINFGVRKKYVSNNNFLANPYYIDGFQKVSKATRTKNMLFGSLSGLVSGLIVHGLVYKSCP